MGCLSCFGGPSGEPNAYAVPLGSPRGGAEPLSGKNGGAASLASISVRGMALPIFSRLSASAKVRMLQFGSLCSRRSTHDSGLAGAALSPTANMGLASLYPPSPDPGALSQAHSCTDHPHRAQV
jgi:hypothetical protein